MKTPPKILEVNTWTWLDRFSQEYHREITLENLPFEKLEEIRQYFHFDFIWFMGVWSRSPASQKIAQTHPGLLKDFRKAKPDFLPDDVVGSPYAIRAYKVDPRLGGEPGLLRIIDWLHAHNIGVLVDFVPNHVAVDHAWVTESPERFILYPRVPEGNLTQTGLPSEDDRFFESEGVWIAHGKDPYFPPWTDTAQLNAFSPSYRHHAAILLQKIAAMGIDGVRCDMTMLMVDRIFLETWGDLAGSPLKEEFWVELIAAVRKNTPNFLFIAEVYWDLEYELQQQGFDFCYDKRLYDRLAHSTADHINAHLTAAMGYQSKLVRFIENHDEPRAFTAFGGPKSRAAACLAYTLPGAYLHHLGQSQGYRWKMPVQLGRGRIEEADKGLARFYRELFAQDFLKYPPKGGYSSEKAEEVREGLTWILLPNLPWGCIGYLWQISRRVDIFLVNFSDTEATFRNLTLPQVRPPKQNVELAWYSLTQLNQQGTLRLSGEKLSPLLTINPWQAVYLTDKPKN